MRRGVLITFGLVLGGCFPCPAQTPLTAPDGGGIVCTRNTDCLVEAGTLVCTMDQDRLYGCLECRQGQCVRWTPESCR
ncbi:MAG: hypothetical protein MUC96_33065 [Myxococcaceae bacterium]|jgi:hypothetical protein|nr:hypothetical protein [Myxococcaceae bacterium]